MQKESSKHLSLRYKDTLTHTLSVSHLLFMYWKDISQHVTLN